MENKTKKPETLEEWMEYFDREDLRSWGYSDEEIDEHYRKHPR